MAPADEAADTLLVYPKVFSLPCQWTARRPIPRRLPKVLEMAGAWYPESRQPLRKLGFCVLVYPFTLHTHLSFSFDFFFSSFTSLDINIMAVTSVHLEGEGMRWCGGVEFRSIRRDTSLEVADENLKRGRTPPPLTNLPTH